MSATRITSVAKKRRYELGVARRLAEKTGLLEVASLSPVKDDPPDVEAVAKDKQRIGIEVTAYHSGTHAVKSTRRHSSRGGSVLVATQARHQRITKRAQAIVESRHKVPLCVEIGWPNEMPRDVDDDAVVTAIVTAVTAAIDGKARPIVVEQVSDLFARIVAPSGSPTLDLMIVWGGSITEPMWDGGFGGILQADPAELQVRIDDKAKQLPTYQEAYDQRWLIIDMPIEGLGMILDHIAAARYDRRGFDRVFFMDDRGMVHLVE